MYLFALKFTQRAVLRKRQYLCLRMICRKRRYTMFSYWSTYNPCWLKLNTCPWCLNETEKMQILLSKDRKKGMKKKNRTKIKEISQRGSAAAWHCLLVQARKHALAKTKATLMPKASTTTATPVLQKHMAAPFLTAFWGALWRETVKFPFVLTKMIEWYIAARDWISWGHHFLSLQVFFPASWRQLQRYHNCTYYILIHVFSLVFHSFRWGFRRSGLFTFAGSADIYSWWVGHICFSWLFVPPGSDFLWSSICPGNLYRTTWLVPPSDI